MSSAPLVDVEVRGLIAASSAAWRHRGNVRATVVVKAALSFANGVLTPVQARPVDPETELAFVLRRAEVLFSGLPTPQLAHARIALWRGDQRLMALDVGAARGAAAELCGRLSPFAPERATHLHGFNPAGFRAPFVQLPDAFDPVFFHAAPEAQRVDNLRGSDALTLDDVYPGHRRLIVRLPTAQVSGTATIDGRSTPLRFVLDTLHIDAKAHRCTLLWRGRLAAKTREALARASAVVALEMSDGGGVEGDMPPPWQSVDASDAIPAGADATTAIHGDMVLQGVAAPTPFDAQSDALPVSASRDDDDAIPAGAGETVGVISGAMLAAAIPFEGKRSDAIPEGAGQTAPVDVRALAGAQEPTPFASQPSPPSDESPASIPGAPWAATPASEVPLPEGAEETLGLAGVSGGLKLPDSLRLTDEEKAAAAAEADREREEAEAARREAEQRAKEQANAEARRAQEAAQFAAEQRAAEKAEAEREAREREARKKARTKIKGFFYDKFKDEK